MIAMTMAHVSFRPAYSGATVDRLYAVPNGEQSSPSDYLYKAIAVDLKNYSNNRDISYLDELKAAYGDGETGEKVRVIAAHLMQIKAAVIPADTTTSGWASTLIQTVIGDVTSLLPNSVYSPLRERGDAFVLGRNGQVLLPARNTAETVSGSFVGQGAPIPVRQGQFLPLFMTPKKLAVITTITREISEHSVPAIEGILKTAMREDTSVAIDSILLDAGAATDIRPAGLKNGVAKSGPTAGGTITALIGDLKLLAAQAIAGSRGNLRAPVWLMNPLDVLAAGMMQAGAGGAFPFADQLAGGMLFGIPVIQSSNVPADSVFLVDAADFVTISGDQPEFEISDQVTLHKEDTTPLAISTDGTPPTVAAPVQSMFQCDCLAIKMRWPINWSMRRAGVVAWSDGVNWAP